MTQRHAIFLTLIFLVIICLIFIKLNDNQEPYSSENIRLESNKQIILITAKGGYLPKNTLAKANIPSVLKVNTQGTYDCSASLVIPELNFKQFLPPQGETQIEIPPQKPGTKITGLCSMGMYNFTLNFN